MDIFIAACFLGVFLLYFHLMPQTGSSSSVSLLQETAVSQQTFELPGSTNKKTSRRHAPDKPSGKSAGGSPTGSGNTNTTAISSDTTESHSLTQTARTVTQIDSVQNDSIQLTITKTQLGEGGNAITYYTADAYLSSIEQLRSAFASGTYGKNMRESTLKMAQDNQALFAISGDSYGNCETGVVARNGVLYRDTVNDAEICVLYYDGTMDILTPSEFDQAEILQKNVWQIWNFGPSLLTGGTVKDTFQTTSYLNRQHPRCAIGYIAPGHYKFVVVDGRDSGYSRGATMSELAQIMGDEGCILAYNLDGGKSSAMVFQNQYINQPADGGRDISDIIYLTTPQNQD